MTDDEFDAVIAGTDTIALHHYPAGWVLAVKYDGWHNAGMLYQRPGVTVDPADLDLALGCVEFGGWAGPNSESVKAYTRLRNALDDA